MKLLEDILIGVSIIVIIASPFMLISAFRFKFPTDYRTKQLKNKSDKEKPKTEL